jgi:hypothetical protein
MDAVRLVAARSRTSKRVGAPAGLTFAIKNSAMFVTGSLAGLPFAIENSAMFVTVSPGMAFAIDNSASCLRAAGAQGVQLDEIQLFDSTSDGFRLRGAGQKVVDIIGRIKRALNASARAAPRKNRTQEKQVCTSEWQ